jgi:hypothetical protein
MTLSTRPTWLSVGRSARAESLVHATVGFLGIEAAHEGLLPAVSAYGPGRCTPPPSAAFVCDHR